MTGRWVIFAVGRSGRPNEFPALRRDPNPLAECPFCPGRESCTTPEVLVLGRPAGEPANSPGWRLRAFPNLFPALVPNGAPVPTPGGEPQVLFGRAPGVGRHEVIVYSPDHAAGPATLGAQDWTELLGVLRARSQDFARHPSVRYVSPFCNHGPEAGATLAHPHMQIIGAPEVPSLAAARAGRQRAHRLEHGRCLLCDLARSETDAGARLIGANDLWTAWAPWASRFPWEMIFVPRRHGASLNGAVAEDLQGLALLLAPVLSALARRHGDPSLNIVLHSASVDAGGDDDDDGSYHWHLEVLPRLSRPAGFEVGTGYTINAVLPEQAALWLRQELTGA